MNLIGTVTDGNGLVIDVLAEAAGDGTYVLTVKVVQGSADLRGFFLNGASLATSSTLEGQAAAVDTNLANDVNMNGTGVTFDQGYEIGTAGIGKDDIQEATFTFSGSLSDLDGLNFGIRATSVGATRNDSVKLVGEFDIVVANQPATITGDDAGSVTEAGTASAGTPVASGSLLVTDPDAGDSAAQAASGASAGGFGVYSVDASGNWTYTLDNNHAAVNALNDGDQLTDSFTVLSLDGSASVTVTIVINGANDAVPLFTDDPDIVDFNAVTAGSYIDGTQYDGLRGDDVVILPVDLAAASAAGYDASRIFFGGAGDDFITGGNLNDKIDGGSDDDTIYGGAGNDILRGGGRNDVICGDAGNDMITGGSGNDTLTGGDGNDVFKYARLSERGLGGEWITDFAVTGPSADKLDLRELLHNLSGYDGSNAFTGGYLRFVGDGSGGTIVQVDSNGGGNSYVNLVTLANTILSASDTSSFIL